MPRFFVASSFLNKGVCSASLRFIYSCFCCLVWVYMKWNIRPRYCSGLNCGLASKGTWVRSPGWPLSFFEFKCGILSLPRTLRRRETSRTNMRSNSIQCVWSVGRTEAGRELWPEPFYFERRPLKKCYNIYVICFIPHKRQLFFRKNVNSCFQ